MQYYTNVASVAYVLTTDGWERRHGGASTGIRCTGDGDRSSLHVGFSAKCALCCSALVVPHTRDLHADLTGCARPGR